MVDHLGITRETDSSCNLNICKLLCNTSLEDGEIPLAALANYRWLGPVPPELQDLTFMEERVIAQATSVAVILRLQKRDPSSYEGLKGHAILLPPIRYDSFGDGTQTRSLSLGQCPITAMCPERGSATHSEK
jgi:hypothetical protein